MSARAFACWGMLLVLASGFGPGAARCWAAEAVAAGAPASGAPDDEDVRARDLFLSGRYEAALAVYTRLYQRTRHPTYQRNIGRCHQMLRQPEEAIRWFEAYLQAAPPLLPAERAEIEGYVAEMRALRATAGAPPPAAQPAPAAPGWSPPPVAAAATTVGVASEPAGTSAASSRKWWVLTGVGALVVGLVVVAVIASRGDSRLPCPAETTCGP